MPRWDKRCADGHVFEYTASYAEHEEAKKAGIKCGTCGKLTETVVGFDPKHGIGIIYNAVGFYGKVPTMDAHVTGNM
jgi:hypothetical protein